MLLLTNSIKDYHFVSQGKTTIPGVNDKEEMEMTDVSYDVTGPLSDAETAAAAARGAAVARGLHC